MEKAKPQKVFVKEFVHRQLDDAYLYYAENYSIEYADKFWDGFFDKIGKILPHYLQFSECRFLQTKNKIYRNIVWENYLIIYKIHKHHIDVICLFHVKQSPKRLKKLKRLK
jgi:plasmid stabilization system protein ParE